MAEKEIKLKVQEALQEEVNKGIVKVEGNLLKEIDAKPGDVVEIEGQRKTVAIADRAYPADIGLNIIRMDGPTRKNAKTGLGEIVTLRKIEVKEAKKVIIAPAAKGMIVNISPPSALKDRLVGKPVVKGDIVPIGGSIRRRQRPAPFAGDDMLNPENLAKFFEESMMPGFGFRELKFIVADTNPKGAVLITEATEVVLNPEAVEVKEETVPEVNYEDIGGLNEEIQKIREMVELPLKHPEIFERLGIEAPKGVLLHGPPGTGKTLLAKAVANETNSHFTVINGPEIMSKFYGESEANLRKIFEEAEKNAPAIIFLDEVDSLAPKREEVKGEVERRVVAQLLSLMDGLKGRGKVVVIAATNAPNILDPALRRPGRFDREIEIGVPSKKGRLKILQIHTRNMPLEKDVVLDEIAEITYGFVGADLSALCKEAAMNVLRRILPDIKLKEGETAIPKEILEKLWITKKDFQHALKIVRPSALREVLIEKPTTKWEDIGGLEEVKQELKEAVELPLTHPEVFARLGIRPPRGIMLYGAPGTGKTLLAKAVANESKANFILVKGPELLSKWVGESEKAVREVFKKARQTSPTIIFFDEIDAMVPRRGISSDSHVIEQVVNQILTELDGLEELHDVVVIAATNRPDIVDPALLRPGRFDRLILTPTPDKATRKKIFEVHLKNMPIISEKLLKEAKKEKIDKEEIVDVDKLTESSEGYVGADIEAVCREAAMLALRKDLKAKFIKISDFKAALEKVRPSVTKEIEKMYDEIKDQFKAATAKQMREESPEYFG